MSTPPPPTLAEILAAVSTLRAPPAPPREEASLSKHAGTIVVAVILALCLWVGNSVTGLNTTVTRMSTTIDTLSKTLTDLQASQDTIRQDVSDAKAVNAKQDARADAIESDVGRVKDRVRILEGQPPIPHPEPAP